MHAGRVDRRALGSSGAAWVMAQLLGRAPMPDEDPSQVQLQAGVGGDEPKSLVELMRVGS
jgi:hypothetical protein